MPGAWWQITGGALDQRWIDPWDYQPCLMFFSLNDVVTFSAL
jgi:hypothetical protein